MGVAVPVAVSLRLPHVFRIQQRRQKMRWADLTLHLACTFPSSTHELKHDSNAQIDPPRKAFREALKMYLELLAPSPVFYKWA
ncbi:hypothetical protein EJB05_49503 [Eragrostis curvula]|uniref:Uncharacterized protein n=1 Tax=Eragrostis curvula TaxID=38414 RepID=A0A5J9T5Q7_9POAL|nr:hypothetical protein EJB05_49503 [Eragrostis curvula]